MKTFVKENWYKMMVGSSMMMASFGFMIYAVSPAYSNNNDHKVEIQTPESSNAPVGTNGVIVGDYAYFVDGGYIYSCKTDQLLNYSGLASSNAKWVGSEFCYDWVGSSGNQYHVVYGKKLKLP
jgi:hypothetical protein